MSSYQIAAQRILMRRTEPLSYERLGEILGIPARSAGQVLAALARRGFKKICKLVVSKKDLNR